MTSLVRDVVDLAVFTTLRLGGPARRFVEAATAQSIVDAVRAADTAGEPLLLLAGGSNLVVGDDGFDGTAVRITSTGLHIDGAGVLHAAAGADWDAVVARTVATGYGGLECLSGIQFFNIEFSENLGSVLQQFNEIFSKYIPKKVTHKKENILKKAMISSLSKSDSQDPSKIFCFKVKRNRDNINRSPFNDNKTKLLRPNLYQKFKEEPGVSFCYSQNNNDEKTDEEILFNFSKRN